MAFRVLICRVFKEGTLIDALAVLTRLRAAAIEHQGYITGETLMGVDDPNKLVVISTWDSLKDWQSWKESNRRLEVEAQLEPFLQRPTDFELFYQGARPSR